MVGLTEFKSLCTRENIPLKVNHGTEDESQLVESLLSMHKAQGSVSSTTQNQACYPSTRKEKAGGSEVFSHPQLNNELKAIPDYKRPCLNNNKKIK